VGAPLVDPAPMPSRPLPARARVAVRVTNLVNKLCRLLHFGSGTVAGGRAGLFVDPQLLVRLATGRRLALVSGTNGKTTTTALLAASLQTGANGPVVTNATGSNMPAGHVAAMAGAPLGAPAVLEVDEGYLPRLVSALHPEVVVLLNISRDQLDRTNEVRMLANRWREALGDAEATNVVANADDPLVVWGAGTASRVTWVSAGQRWRADSVGCPSCGYPISFHEDASQGGSGVAWSCQCGNERPTPQVRLEDDSEGEVFASFVDGSRSRVTLQIPGRFNQSNAVMAAAAAMSMGVSADAALEAMGAIRTVAGRFSVIRVDGVPTRVILAKNPAGWTELLDLIGQSGPPVVVGINARIADGKDPSWLWDVPFEMLRGRKVVATGDRCLDLAVRLRYADVSHEIVKDQPSAVQAAGVGLVGDPAIDFIGNYTAFRDLIEGRR